MRARTLKRDAFAIYLACRDPRTPWGVRLLGAVVVAYAFSPIDLIPDWIPLIGYLDDLVLLPLGIALVVRLTPPAVLADCRVQAEQLLAQRPISRIAGLVIVLLWLAGLVLAAVWLWRAISSR